MIELLLLIDNYLGVTSFVIAVVLGLIGCMKMYRKIPAIFKRRPAIFKRRYGWRIWSSDLALGTALLTLALWVVTYLLLGELILFTSWLTRLF